MFGFDWWEKDEEQIVTGNEGMWIVMKLLSGRQGVTLKVYLCFSKKGFFFTCMKTLKY
jgi:hypothetical protein